VLFIIAFGLGSVEEPRPDLGDGAHAVLEQGLVELRTDGGGCPEFRGTSAAARC